MPVSEKEGKKRSEKKRKEIKTKVTNKNEKRRLETEKKVGRTKARKKYTHEQWKKCQR